MAYDHDELQREILKALRTLNELLSKPIQVVVNSPTEQIHMTITPETPESKQGAT
jgi:hypothetical protein